ncbi:NAD(P)(+) transhydrogenase (Re/Si-specific) subunit beta [soil metagenome]
MTSSGVVSAAYLVAAVSFILALKGLSSPRTARAANLLGAAGMLVAVAVTFALDGLRNEWLMVAGMLLGTIIGVPAARAVKMTAVPQMVAFFNGVGGAAAALVSIADYLGGSPDDLSRGAVAAVLFSTVVGCVSASGSLVTFLKLQEVVIGGRPITYPAQKEINGLVVVALVVLATIILLGRGTLPLTALAVLALLLGASFVLPIGGADVPVAISLLNSFTGLAVAATGFVLANTLLIVAGTLVGASGTLLTRLMSQAMGRPLGNILFGALGAVAAKAGAGDDDRSVRAGRPEDIGILLAYSRKVVIVPGYGLAVAQAQHTCRELAQALEAKGVEVTYAIHPVAGRMPGHMNVLLAEADVPYERLVEMDEANGEMPVTDVALVVGANDVVNPAARDAPDSPIYGMPILEVDRARNVVFLKRSMRPGFAGIDNTLLYDAKTIMLFGDAKESLTRLVASIQLV